MNRVSITIDVEHPDRPCRPNNFVALTEALIQESVSPTFFIEGRYAKANLWLADALKGQTIGNHGMFHVHHDLLNDRGIEESVIQGERVLREIFGCETKPLFRLPYGNVSPRALEILHGLGYKHCTWSYDPRDWEGEKDPLKIATICQQSEFNTLAFHSWPDVTAGILIPLVQELKRLKFEFTSIISSHMV